MSANYAIEQIHLALPPPLQLGRALPAEAANRASNALGQAVVHCWSRLPRDMQQELFEAAVRSEGETIRQPLAIFLHGAHARTTGALQARSIPEPDSLGG